jgi:AraC-like DNA-binding protein
VTSYIEFDMAGWPPGRHRGLPDSSLAIVFSLGEPVTIGRAGCPDLTVAASVGGLHRRPIDIVHTGVQRGIQLELTPRGARALLSVPAAELTGGVWSLDEVVGQRAAELLERLEAARGGAERAAILDRVLASWATDDGYPVAVDAAWRALTGPATSVSQVATDLDLSRRHLNHIVRAELGLAPKTIARIARFGEARRCLTSGRATSLAQAAALCGYFDQAHMTNEWKELGDCTPGEWVAAELPFLQDSLGVPAAS